MCQFQIVKWSTKTVGGGAPEPTCTVNTPAAGELKGTAAMTVITSHSEPTSIRVFINVILSFKLQRSGGKLPWPLAAQ